MGDPHVARNTVLLSATLTCLSGAIQLAVAVGTVTLVLVTGVHAILGLGPAILLGSGAVAALGAGRLMDRHGRVPVLAGGALLGVAACSIVALGCATVQAALVVLGLALMGASNGTVVLARAAGGDMYPPERRARGISFVLFGAVFGALLGPLVWRPLFGGREFDTQGLVVPWLVAAGMMGLAFLLVVCVRPDPKKIALLYAPPSAARDEAAPLAEIVRRPGVATALLAALASFAVMVSVMNLTGAIMVGHGHEAGDVFPVISAHIVGMYGLVLVVGDLIERLGRRNALVSGLAVMAASTAVLGVTSDVFATGVALFGLGLGWSFSYVAATSDLVDLSGPSERGRLVGFSDLLSSGTGAVLALAGGAAYSALGDVSVAVGGAALALAPALWIAARSARRPAPTIA